MKSEVPVKTKIAALWIMISSAIFGMIALFIITNYIPRPTCPVCPGYYIIGIAVLLISSTFFVSSFFIFLKKKAVWLIYVICFPSFIIPLVKIANIERYFIDDYEFPPIVYPLLFLYFIFFFIPWSMLIIDFRNFWKISK